MINNNKNNTKRKKKKNICTWTIKVNKNKNP